MQEPKTAAKPLDQAQDDFVAAIENFQTDVLAKEGIHLRYAMTFGDIINERTMEDFRVEKDYELNEEHVATMGRTMRGATEWAEGNGIMSSHDYAYKSVIHGLFDKKSRGSQDEREAAGFILRLRSIAKKYSDNSPIARAVHEKATSSQMRTQKLMGASTEFLNAFDECVHSARHAALLIN